MPLVAEHLQALADLFTEQDTLRWALEASFVILAEDAKERSQAELLRPIPNFNKAVQWAAESEAFENAMAKVRQTIEESVRATAEIEPGGQSAG